MKDIPQEVRDYMAFIGRKGGLKNKEKGVEYFREMKRLSDLAKKAKKSK